MRNPTPKEYQSTNGARAEEAARYFTISRRFANPLVLQSAGILAMRVGGAVTTYLILILLARWMGAAELGSFVFGLSIATVLSFVSTLGFPAICTRFITQYATTGRWAKVKGFVRTGNFVIAISSLVLTLGAILVIWGFDLHGKYGFYPLLVACAGIPVLAFGQFYREVARARFLVYLAYFPQSILRQVLFFLALSIAYLMEVPISALVALSLMMSTALAATMIQGVRVTSELAAKTRDHKAEYERALWARTALPMMMIMGIQRNFPAINVALAGAFVRPEVVAIYNSSYQTAQILSIVIYAVGAVYGPYISKLIATDDFSALRRLAVRQMHLAFWPTLLGVLMLVLFGEFILTLFGAEFAEGYTALLILCLAPLARAFFGPSATYLILGGHERPCLAAVATGLCFTIALNIVLVPLYGMIGGAVSALAGTLLWSIWLYALVRRRMGIDTSLFSMFSAPPGKPEGQQSDRGGE